MRDDLRKRIKPVFIWVALLAVWHCVLPVAAATPDYSSVQVIFDKHCVDCHGAQDPEKGLVMETFESLMKGGESGAALVPGQSADSLLVKMIEGKLEREGKKLIMPPGKRKKLDTNEIALVKAWIDGGAKAPTQMARKEIQSPKIKPTVPPRHPVNALAYSSRKNLLAVARHGEVELLSASSRARVRSLKGHRGAVNAVAFSSDGKYLFAAGGEAGIAGEIRQWDIQTGELVRALDAHSDAIYSMAVSPDDQLLATGSYDQKIKLWSTDSGAEVKTLSGHNGAVFGLSFRPDGKILASASADRTVKLWDVTSGERRDTLSQPLKEQYAVAFDRDGKRLVAGGADNRIRLWEISANAAETTNPLLESRFAHEGAILRLAFSFDGATLASSADDRTVKFWKTSDLTEKLSLEKQPDWPTGLALAGTKLAVVGRLDGTFEFYNADTGKIAPQPAPTVSQIEPRGVQRGVLSTVRLRGSNLAYLTAVHASNTNLAVKLIDEMNDSGDAAWVGIHSSPELKPGPYEIWVSAGTVESGKMKVYVDNLPQVTEADATNAALALPTGVWGTLNPPGDRDQFSFTAKAGQLLVFDLQAKTLGSKANPVLTLLDASGKVVASNNDFDGTDPLIAQKFEADGQYTVRVSELMLAGSADHFYRLSAGELPFVAAVYPLTVSTGKSEVRLIGYNMPRSAAVKVTAQKAGDTEVPIDAEVYRSRRRFTVQATEMLEMVETEPNDVAGRATPVSAPVSVAGQVWAAGSTRDVDLFRFAAKKGQQWIVETQAAQNGSPVDTRVEVLDSKGKPVERLVLQASRDTMINFRASTLR